MVINFSNNHDFEAFLQTLKRDRLIRFNISRNTLVAFLFSLAIHALILFLVIPKIEFEKPKESPTFEVVLAQPEQAEAIQEHPQEAIPERLPEPVAEPVKRPPKVITKQAARDAKPPVFSVPNVLATNRPEPEALPQKADKTKEPDMFAALNAKRAERERAESEAAKINAEAAARETGPTEEEKRDAKIKSNFQNGTNGIFEITSLGSRSASFTFLGWLNDYSTSKRQYFEVEASTGQDVRLVMIRKMIGLIREHYQGDFNWESRRLGRTVIKSARVEDSAELEDFLMTEFFGTNYKTVL